MDEQEIISEVAKYLEKYEICSLDTFKEQTINQLLNIELYFKKCGEIYDEVTQKLDYINLTTRGICKNSKISKSTIYNNPDTLKKYIECRISDMKYKIIIPKEEVERLEKENLDLKDILDKTLINKIKYMNLKNENMQLKKQLSEMHEVLDLYKQERKEHINKINKLEKRICKEDNILEFRK